MTTKQMDFHNPHNDSHPILGFVVSIFLIVWSVSLNWINLAHSTADVIKWIAQILAAGAGILAGLSTASPYFRSMFDSWLKGRIEAVKALWKRLRNK